VVGSRGNKALKRWSATRVTCNGSYVDYLAVMLVRYRGTDNDYDCESQDAATISKTLCNPLM